MDPSAPFASPMTASMFKRFMSAGGDLNKFIDSLTVEETRTLKNMARKGAKKSDILTMTEAESLKYRHRLKTDKAYRNKTMDDIANFSPRAKFCVGIARALAALWG
jgi:hypothetical protein